MQNCRLQWNRVHAESSINRYTAACVNTCTHGARHERTGPGRDEGAAATNEAGGRGAADHGGWAGLGWAA